MNKERNQPKKTEEITSTPVREERETKPRSSAFNEPGPQEEKSTINSEEADLEQDRKDAMTERD